MRNGIAKLRRISATALLLVPLGLALLSTVPEGAEEPLRVCATIPDLGDITRELGGEAVSVTVFTKGPEDPHFVEPRPGFIKALSRANLFVQMGLGMEIGWAPVLLRSARNGSVLPGAPGYLDGSENITPLEIPTVPVDRSMGDVHPSGNPHYLTDPLEGLRVARLIRERLIALRPSKRRFFEERYGAFEARIGAALVGEKLAAKYDFEKLAQLFEHGRLGEFLKGQGEQALLGGWLGKMLPYAGTKVVAEHNAWSYFARRFGIEVIGFLEPKPGISPTTKHLAELVRSMRAEEIGIVLAVSYFSTRHARFVSEKTGARVAELAHQVGSREGTETYFAMVDYNVSRLAAALEGTR